MLLLATIWIGSRSGPVEGPVNVAGNPVIIDANDLPVLENFDVLSNFELLTDLPQPVQSDEGNQQDTNQEM
jgi:hypothetical protein